MARVEEDRHPGDTGGRARRGQDGGGAEERRHDTGDFQDVTARDGSQSTRAVTHRAMVTTAAPATITY
ncbi:hypothetical protein MTIM_13130 [Mycobacterium timonense]|uniref:Uncharacterized protein n=1 Tax=Mycobacterium timonense TaxID=701043 RepID=A0A7I9Z3B5_9MYCO|nr:hypothetical protein MTIM_13130 [Mycobacterium timonense]